jgi:hypothetical protein
MPVTGIPTKETATGATADAGGGFPPSKCGKDDAAPHGKTGFGRVLSVAERAARNAAAKAKPAGGDGVIAVTGENPPTAPIEGGPPIQPDPITTDTPEPAPEPTPEPARVEPGAKAGFGPEEAH